MDPCISFNCFLSDSSSHHIPLVCICSSSSYLYQSFSFYPHLSWECCLSRLSVIFFVNVLLTSVRHHRRALTHLSYPVWPAVSHKFVLQMHKKHILHICFPLIWTCLPAQNATSPAATDISNVWGNGKCIGGNREKINAISFPFDCYQNSSEHVEEAPYRLFHLTGEGYWHCMEAEWNRGRRWLRLLRISILPGIYIHSWTNIS